MRILNIGSSILCAFAGKHRIGEQYLIRSFSPSINYCIRTRALLEMRENEVVENVHSEQRDKHGGLRSSRF